MGETDIRAEVFQRVRKVVAEVLKVGEDRITLESRYSEDLHLDSFDNLSLLMALEDEFDRSIEDEGAQQLATVGETVDFIVRLADRAAGAASPAPSTTLAS
ncbi:MAG TPA: acyl carrier protein [Thermoanaerobaculia bacterium]|nr:acyl carrier protein [Thermoanaerobaculia bacterium]